MIAQNTLCLRSYEEACAFLNASLDYEKLISYQYNTSTFSLDRMVRLLEQVGNPHREFSSLHITGTKGKGSTAIMLSTVLQYAGYKTGLFTSPHLTNLKERIQFNHTNISKEDFTAALNILVPYIQRLRNTNPAESPTFFETLTAICFLYFKEKQAEMAVLEVGMGGRLDATNVVLPLVSVITNIGLDHVNILGNTISRIAYEKAGIIKKGIPVISAAEKPEALSVIKEVCMEKGAPLYLLGKDIRIDDAQPYTNKNSRGLLCNIKTWQGAYGNLFIPLMGIHQVKNCAMALGALEVLREHGKISIDNETIREAFTHVRCPGRIEVLGETPLIVLDFAHTVESMASLRETLFEHFTFNKLVVILGFSQDKDIDNILREIVPCANDIFVTKSTNSRAAPPEELAKKIKAVYGKRAEICNSARDAVIAAQHAASTDDLLCITGSAYIAGEVRQELANQNIARA
ncbi:folylpolyglutamate synthase/dihydrofolate synthase family protein [Candidatus Kuenenia sp.]|uniref:bifunctional folylpolyglutamate synthase/dihydrofolate synthase n=1 Tax=Candidatus Kuenenia sp. TaxID=2499824 RepID=UPI003220866C